MRVIAVDIGNSSTKFALANEYDTALGKVHLIDNRKPLESSDFDGLDSNVRLGWAVCSVHPVRANEFKEWISRHRRQDQFHLIQPADIPLASDVQSRDALGRDRLLAAWQARQMHPQGRLVTIDAGTAVTIDLVTADSVFAGGVIFPGARTMLQMLARQTAALPDLSSIGIRGAFEREVDFETGKENEFPVVGKSTQQAILMGVYLSQISAIKSIVAAIESQSSEPLTILTTGGGLKDLQPWLPKDWIFDPLLLLRGISSLARLLFRDQIR